MELAEADGRSPTLITYCGRTGYGRTMSQVFVVEAIDLSEAETPNAEMLIAPVTWPDGRVDNLPHTCSDQDIEPVEILKRHPTLHLGFDNVLAGMTSGYDSADLARLSSDVFYSRVGDVTGGEVSAHYLRGAFGAVIRHWLDRIVNYMMPPTLPWDALILCAQYGLLTKVTPDEDHGYEVNRFLETLHEDMWGMVIDFDHSLPETDMHVFVKMFEDDGCIWPRRVSAGDPEATAAWQERVRG